MNDGLDDVRAELEKTLRAIDMFCLSGQAEPRRAGDVDYEQLMAYWNCSEETVRGRMKAAVRAGKVISLRVWDPEKREKLRIWRRLEEGD